MTHPTLKPMPKPTLRPENPNFSSGPCSKRPGWSPAVLAEATVGRSHRSNVGKEKLNRVITLSKQLLDLPADYRLGIVPASDTGAVEMAMWSLLGGRLVDMFAWESFSQTWLNTVAKQLQIPHRAFVADYGKLPDLSQYQSDNDCVFVYNGTTSGVRVPNLDWIADDRSGLTICDATSAVFSQAIDFQKLDVITWSWQKVLGGEAAHGMIALSPRAVERLETYTPPWALPKIFTLAKNGKLIEDIFTGSTINTPSMLCVEDVLDSLTWVEQLGGQTATQAISDNNLALVAEFVQANDWIDFLAETPETRSNTSMCLQFTDPTFTQRPQAEQKALIKSLCQLLADEGVAYDINAYKTAPPGLRIWGGATVQNSDIAALLPWITWGYQQVINT